MRRQILRPLVLLHPELKKISYQVLEKQQKTEIMKQKKVLVSYNKGNKFDHYEMTPYSYIPQVGKKFTNSIHVDFGQGIMQLIEEIRSNK